MMKNSPKNHRGLIRLNQQKSILSGALFILLSIFACYVMKTYNSLLFYVISCLYFVFIPIMNRKTRAIFVMIHTIGMITFVIASGIYRIHGVELIILQPVFMIIVWYQQNLMIRYIRMTNRLRRKTISSECDELTGLLNRRGLKNRIDGIWAGCIRHQTPIAVIELDIDFFKQFNDAYGHPCGDQCLESIAEALRNSLAQDRAVITRTGGEEFLIFIRNADQMKLVSIARKIAKNIEKLAIVQSCQDVSRYVTVSIGISHAIPKEEDTFEMFYQKADQELYHAKSSGRNCISFNGIIYGKKHLKSNSIFQKKNII